MSTRSLQLHSCTHSSKYSVACKLALYTRTHVLTRTHTHTLWCMMTRWALFEYWMVNVGKTWILPHPPHSTPPSSNLQRPNRQPPALPRPEVGGRGGGWWGVGGGPGGWIGLQAVRPEVVEEEGELWDHWVERGKAKSLRMVVYRARPLSSPQTPSPPPPTLPTTLLTPSI